MCVRMKGVTTQLSVLPVSFCLLLWAAAPATIQIRTDALQACASWLPYLFNLCLHSECDVDTSRADRPESLVLMIDRFIQDRQGRCPSSTTIYKLAIGGRITTKMFRGLQRAGGSDVPSQAVLNQLTPCAGGYRSFVILCSFDRGLADCKHAWLTRQGAHEANERALARSSRSHNGNGGGGPVVSQQSHTQGPPRLPPLEGVQM